MFGQVTLRNTHRHFDEQKDSTPLSSSLQENIEILTTLFDGCDDLIMHHTEIGSFSGCFLFLQGLVKQQALYEIEQRLALHTEFPISQDDLPSFIRKQFTLSTIMEASTFHDVSAQILTGNTVLLLNEFEKAFAFHSSNDHGRIVSSPSSERTVRGPQEGFVEDIEKNLSLIRRKIKTPSLKVENLTIGEQTNTQISVVYMKGIANEDIVKEVHQRLSRIKIDGILDSHYVESMIKDAPKSPVPTVLSTERPDRVCGGLLEGKVAILVDGSPFVLTVPALFVEFLHSSEDYYDGALVATIIRWIRFLGLFVTLILPSFYVALISYHPDLLQNPFIIRIAANREALPYPVLIEAIFMQITFELLREAGLRMPKTLGGAIVSILGLVLIGQAAVQAGIVGPVLTVVVSVTALTSFILPNYAFHQIIRFSSIPLLILSGLFGFMGIIIGLMFGLTYLVSLRSFGVPYFSPVSPARKESWKDVFIRAPWWAMETRPADFGNENIVRASSTNYTKPPVEKEDEE